METRKIFDMGQMRSQDGKESVATPMTYKRITIGGVSPKEEPEKKSDKKELTLKQLKAKEKKRRQRIENLRLRIIAQDERINNMKDGPMKTKSKAKLDRMEKELESLEGE